MMMDKLQTDYSNIFSSILNLSKVIKKKLSQDSDNSLYCRIFDRIVNQINHSVTILE